MRQRILATSTRRRKLICAGWVESQYLVGAASPSGHSISSHSCSTKSGIARLYPTRTRTRAKRDDSQSAEPSRHLIVRHALFASLKATSLTETRSGSSLRLFVRFNLLPIRCGPVPGGHAKVLD